MKQAWVRQWVEKATTMQQGAAESAQSAVWFAFLVIVQRWASPGLIVHYDSGSQYASHAYRDLLTRHGL